jgi:hypothetical protein
MDSATLTERHRFTASSRQAKLLAEFDARPMTDFEAARRIMPPDPEHLRSFDATRRRCSDLRAAGYIEDSGKPLRGMAKIWQITETGREALRRLLETGWSR